MPPIHRTLQTHRALLLSIVEHGVVALAIRVVLLTTASHTPGDIPADQREL